MKHSPNFIFIVSLTSFLISPFSALAAQNTTHQKSLGVITSASSRVLDKKKREKEEKRLLREAKAPGVVLGQKKTSEEAPVAEARFFVKTIQLEGNTKISTEEFRPLIQPYEQHEWILGELQKLTQAITEKYEQRGYITSLAYIPEQDVQNGLLIIKVIEGKVGKFSVEGNRYFRKQKILSYARLKPGEILRAENIRVMLRNLNENPDREVSALMRAGELPETTDIHLNVHDHFPLHAGFGYDNQGIVESGKQRFNFSLTDTNLTGLDDIFSVGTLFGRHFAFVFPQYQIPLSSYTNTKLVAGMSHGHVTTKKLDAGSHAVNNLSQTYSIGLLQPVIKTDNLSLDLQTSFDVKESHTLEDAATFTRERLRVIPISPLLAFQNPWGGVTTWANDFIFGMGSLGAAIFADSSAARQGVKPHFFQFHGNLTHHQKLPFETQGILRFEYQHSSRKLPAQQEFYLGGATSIRGYPEGDYLSDSGILWSFELDSPTFFIPKDWQLPYSKTPLRQQIEWVSFLDEAYGRLRGPSSFETNERHLLGMGAGLKIHLGENLSARVEWAYALGGHPLTDSSRDQFYFRLSMEK